MLIDGWRVSTRLKPCEATITSSEVGQRRGKRSAIVYFADIKFSYEVGGTAYTSGEYSRMSAGSGNRDTHLEVARKYPAGSTHDAWYDPSSPGDAYLMHNTTEGVLYPMAFLAFGLFMAGYGIFVIIRKQ